jgi:quinol monooxygenase YgiN
MTINNEHVHVVATLKAQPGRAGELAEVLTELARASRNEPGNLVFNVLRQLSDREQMVVIEHWDGVASVDAHMASEHVGEALAKLGPLLAAPPQIVRYTRVA